MKKILLLFSFFIFFIVNNVYSDSYYNVPEQETIVISSTTYTTISWSYGYREVYIGDPDLSTTVYYKVDGSTNNIVDKGWWFYANEKNKIEFNGDIHLQLEPGEADITLRKLIFRR